MEMIRLYVEVPHACFRVAQAREYWETYPCPAPSTVYGMLLSLVGEENRLVHKGAEIAIALVSVPQRSVVMRTLWRVKEIKIGPGIGSNKRPDFQETLSDIKLSVWVRPGNDKASPTLLDRLRTAFQDPGSVTRYGGLSLGESTQLVDEVRLWRSGDPGAGNLLEKHNNGDLSFPIWPDHVGSKGTEWGQFRLSENAQLGNRPSESAWVVIRPPASIA